MENTQKPLPDHLLPFLGPYQAIEVDRSAQVTVGWGYPIIAQVGEAGWAELGLYGTMSFNPVERTWALITKKLTDEEAIATYGPLNKVEHGPRGGFKSVTFGVTTFTSKLFKREKPC